MFSHISMVSMVDLISVFLLNNLFLHDVRWFSMVFMVDFIL